MRIRKSFEELDIGSFGEKLLPLIKEKGFTDLVSYAEDFYRSSAAEYINSKDFKADNDNTEKQRINSMKAQLKKHLKYSAREVDQNYIMAYCDYFGCSADYLLGYIDTPNHEIQTVADITGLSVDAIERLKFDYHLLNVATTELENLLNVKNSKEKQIDERHYFSMKLFAETNLKAINAVILDPDLKHYINEYISIKDAKDKVFAFEDKDFYQFADHNYNGLTVTTEMIKQGALFGIRDALERIRKENMKEGDPH